MNRPLQTSAPQPAPRPAPASGGSLIVRARNPYWLAPMAGITDVAFRQLMDEMGAGVLVSELVSAKGLRHNSQKTRKMMRVHPDPGTLVGIQLFGEEPGDLGEAARQVRETGAHFIDINLGCPVKKVIKKGCGAALMRDPAYLETYLAQIRNHIDLPLTVKMRTGWSDEEKTIHECVAAATNAGCDWVAIHGRTRTQGYSGRADWDLIAEVKQRAQLPIIGNGDIRSADRARQCLEEYGVDAVMIGRAALRNPWIFQECQGKGGRTARGSLAVLHRYLDLLTQHYDTRLTLILLRKFAAWMAFGYPGAAAFRGSLFQLHSIAEVMETVDTFFRGVSHLSPPGFDESEAFLMGGHG